MTNIKIILSIISFFFLSNIISGQDVIRLEKKPRVIIKSWYPEFKEFPKLKIGDSKILFTMIPDFDKTSIRNNDINLIPSSNNVEIEETEKTNQYLITVNATKEKNVEFELWFALENKTILIRQNSKWEEISKLYPTKSDRILIDTIKLELIK